MREILTLAGYEYKKIFQRKVNWIALGVVFIIVLFSGAALTFGDVYVEGERVGSQREVLQEERKAVEALNGTLIDDELLAEAERAYANVGEGGYWINGNVDYETYKANIYPYEFIQDKSSALKEDYGSGSNPITGEEFYDLRESYMKQNYEGQKLSEGEIEKHVSEMEELDTPMTYGWTKGYHRYNQLVFMNGMFLAFALAICIAPLFAGEYTSRVDQLILTSKYGKNKAILAKLLTGFSVAFLSSLLMNLVLLVEIGIIYGLGNWDFPIQSVSEGFFLSIPINLLTMTVIVVLYQVLSACMSGAVIIFCSQKMKSPFGVMIVAALLTFVPLLLTAVSPEKRILYLLIRFLPNGVMEGAWIFDDLLFHVGNGYFYIFQVVPVVWVLLCIAAGIAVYQGFRKRQIGGR